MHLSTRLADIPTIRLCWIALALLVVGRLLDAITGPLWVHFGLHATALEYIGGDSSFLATGHSGFYFPFQPSGQETGFISGATARYEPSDLHSFLVFWCLSTSGRLWLW